MTDVSIELPEFAHLADSDAVAAEAPVEREAGFATRTLPKIAAPLLLGCLFIGGWELAVRAYGIPYYVLPGPFTVLQTLVEDWPLLFASLLVTLRVAFLALILAAFFGASLAIAFSQSKIIEMSFFPYAVILQVTPIVAVAPLIIIWVDDVRIALLICAWIVAFFPILSNTTLGLNSADHNLVNLFRLYEAGRWQTLRFLKLPAAMPYFLAGLKISGGLSLIGAVVAEFVAGTGGKGSGLAYRILEAGFQLKIPRLFAALLLISATGVLIFIAMSLLSHFLLRHWHESAIRAEN